MRIAAALIPLLALAACSTPRESCINEATSSLRQVNRFIAETEANISRGYGLRTEQRVIVVRDLCEGVTADGVKVVVRCEKNEVEDFQVRVPLNLNSERARLESLYEQQRDLQVRADPVVQACIATYPE